MTYARLMRSAVLVILLTVLTFGLIACDQRNIPPDRILYVASLNGSGAITSFSDQGINANTIPQIPPAVSPLPSGLPNDMRVVGNTLYVATGGKQQAQPPVTPKVEQYAINSVTRALSLRNSTPLLASPPFEMATTDRSVYVAALGPATAASRGRILSFSIDPTGNLAAPQTTIVANVKRVTVDDSGRFLFAATFADIDDTSGQVCVFPIGSDGLLPAAPTSCINPGGTAQSMTYANGVLYMLLRGLGEIGVVNVPTYYVSAWAVDSSTGALTQRGANLDVNRAGVGRLMASSDARFLFLPRAGGFLTIRSDDPMEVVAEAVAGTGRNSTRCVWPPVAGGYVAIVPDEEAIYVADPAGSPPSGLANVTKLAIGPAGALSPIVCDTRAAPISAIAFWKR